MERKTQHTNALPHSLPFFLCPGFLPWAVLCEDKQSQKNESRSTSVYSKLLSNYLDLLAQLDHASFQNLDNVVSGMQNLLIFVILKN